MAYTNNLLFNNVFLKNLNPSEEDIAAAQYLVHDSARGWFHRADLSTHSTITDTWIRPLLNQQSLDLVPTELYEDHAWHIVAPWDRENPLALCYVAPHGTDLSGYSEEKTLPKGQHWMIRAVNLARECSGNNLRWVILTNSQQWRLMDAWSLRRYEAFLEIDLYHLLMGEDDPMAAYLFHRLLRLEDSLERDGESGKNKLDMLLERSVKATEATERYLKISISDNLASAGGGDGIMAQLCMGIVHAVDPQGTKAFSEQEREGIYTDATYLLYRLLFILYAEAQNLLPVDRTDYAAVSLRRLIDEAVELREDAQKAAERPASIWNHLRTLFNAIHYSDEYLGIPPYNGGLFNDEDRPYLRDYAIENRFLAEALYELAFLDDSKGELPPERIDYRDLSVRHLGSLYEGMIEYKLFIADEKLYALREKNGRVQYLNASTSKPISAYEAIEPGKVYFAQSPRERRATGTHYTTEELVERLVRQTVLRLLEDRWEAFGGNLEDWLKEIETSPSEDTRVRLRNWVDRQFEAFVSEQVLSLRICDPAMGSGHFLVHIAHTVANFILRVLTLTPWDNPAVNLDPNYWRRQVVENCLYGVDINAMAVELAKLSLWLVTMQPGKPLSFLDHRLKRGNSLLTTSLGEILETVNQSDLYRETRSTIEAESKGQYSFRHSTEVMEKVEQANLIWNSIVRRIVDRAEDVVRQAQDYEELQQILTPLKEIGNLLVAHKIGLKARDVQLHSIAQAIGKGRVDLLPNDHKEMLRAARDLLAKGAPFHWELEFPHVFFQDLKARTDYCGGFDVIIGNPPFLGGHKMRRELGKNFVSYLLKGFQPAGGQADLCAYFLKNNYLLAAVGGNIGVVATNTIGQGDSRAVGLRAILGLGGIIHYADRYVQWKGDATVEVNLVALRKPMLGGACPVLLDGERVHFVSSHLDDLPENEAFPLVQNRSKGFRGQSIGGEGFALHHGEADRLIELDPKNKDCLYPYLNGEDFNNRYGNIPAKIIINFGDRSLDQAEKYPHLLSIVKQRVLPERMKVPVRNERNYWWRFARSGERLYSAISDLNRVLVRSRVSELNMIDFLPTGFVFGDALVVFALDGYYHFALLQGSIHEIWLRRHASSLRTDVRYTPTDCFQTFPFPQDPHESDAILAEISGREYQEHRTRFQIEQGLGLTKTYKCFNDPMLTDHSIQELRHLHTEMDRHVLACYGWQDIEMEHDFYSTERKKIRYMPSRAAQREVFTRLIALNQDIAAHEAALGLTVDANERNEEADTEDD